ncbi:Saccharopine dehydrogenase, NADP-dependent [Arachidicoccus rhizosphaerae]|jgi:saccharopine dehydrogenase-like NADP-dependent oxidoreductase|uniref:Saccharopine dehydrogenase, NADP-dependent n=1 Tax=Arachidicoccus rhizosphaerae TaxID=551991 RepID=A0A1H3WXI7_9BACT|nr:saccharopine dehydrogenase C-terminal domain-containing protein [Arachidicoccus rhizosphaerae]SDZ91819.1 Saccharopine dehydrogenase, NADP-dependent [Arachidicoccus rhizosphaerae]
MTKVLIIGGGKIGQAAAFMLHQDARFEITVADQNENLLNLAKTDGLSTLSFDVQDTQQLEAALESRDMVLSACPYFLNVQIARAAKKTHTHYFDLTEDVRATGEIRQLAQGADVSFMPQCGLAPGFVSIAAYDLCKQFDRLESVRLRVGALPQFPVNRLKYNLTWSTNGLVNEYCNGCDAIVAGKRTVVQPLEGYEHLMADGIDYEAFNTSGGLASLAEVLEGKVQSLDYKTVRYPGHRDLMQFLLEDMGFIHRREQLVELLDQVLPFAPQDKVLVFITVSGEISGRFTQKVFTRTILNQEVSGKPMTAIQVTTAGSAAAVMDLHEAGKLPQKGFIRQEDVQLAELMRSHFVRFYQ